MVASCRKELSDSILRGKLKFLRAISCTTASHTPPLRTDMTPGIEIIWTIPEFPQYATKRICSSPCSHKSGLEVGDILQLHHHLAANHTHSSRQLQLVAGRQDSFYSIGIQFLNMQGVALSSDTLDVRFYIQVCE